MNAAFYLSLTAHFLVFTAFVMMNKTDENAGIFFTAEKKSKNNYICGGEMAEWSIAAVLKTVVRATEPGVRIPLSPQSLNGGCLKRDTLFF